MLVISTDSSTFVYILNILSDLYIMREDNDVEIYASRID